MPTSVLSNFAPLIERYEGFILDQWGVLHDGQTIYPGVIATLEAIRAADRKIILLSNSGKRAAANEQRLAAMGLSDALYDSIVTSGEIAWAGLKDRRESLFADLGQHCLLISRGDDRSTIENLTVRASSAEDADFVLLAGTDSSRAAVVDIETQLAIALRRNLTLICCNPDFTSVEPGSELGRAPGSFALDYRAAGGDVHFVGKPWPAVYEAVLARLALAPDQLLAVGDSLHHDIKGAVDAGIDSALVRGGVHRETLAGDFSPEQVLQRLARLIADDAPPPTWVLPAFKFD